MIRWEIDEAVNGYRVDIWPEDVEGRSQHIKKENTETRLQALNIIYRYVQQEILKEGLKLKKSSLEII